MPLTNFDADRIPGKQNEQDFAAIQDLLAAKFPSEAPFLLFPVRLETRFMRVERPAPIVGLSAALQHLDDWVSKLEEVARLELATDFGVDALSKKAVKRKEADLAAELDVRIGSPGASLVTIEKVRDLAHEERRHLQELADRAQSAEVSALKQLDTLRSPYLREHYRRRMEAEGSTGVARRLRRVSDRVALWSQLRTVPAGEVGPGAEAIGPVVLASAEQRTLLSTAVPMIFLEIAALDRTAAALRSLEDRLTSHASEDDLLSDCAQLAILPASKKKELLTRAGSDAVRAALSRVRSDETESGQVGLVVAATEAALADELWVRVYPDDVSIDTHEGALTDAEVAEGRRFWVEHQAAAGDERLKKGAFRALAARFGARRAAWVAQSLEPRRPAAVGELGAVVKALDTLERRLSDSTKQKRGRVRLQGVLRAFEAAERAVKEARRGTEAQLDHALKLLRAIAKKVEGLRKAVPLVESESVEAIRRMRQTLEVVEKQLSAVEVVKEGQWEHPDVPRKDSGWTRAPVAPLLPDRFVVVAVDDQDRVQHLVVGAPIHNLKVGIDPSAGASQAERFAIAANGDLVAGESIRWMVDFDTAVARGMGVVLPISTDEAKRGFKRVYAVGIKDLNASEGSAAVAALLDGHRHTSGLGLLPVGAPTNNTEDEPSAYSSTEDPDQAYVLAFGPPAFLDKSSDTDGASLARALGIPARVPQRLAYAAGRDGAEAALLNRALWPATGGAFMEEMLATLFSLDTRDRITHFFERFVSARPLVPTLRVGSQPYGIQVTTAFSRFVPRTGGTLPTASPATPAQLEQRFWILLRDTLAQAARDWSAIADAKVLHAHSPNVQDAQAHFLSMLGLHPVGVARAHRFALNCARRAAGPGSSDLRFGLVPTEGPFALLTTFELVFRKAYGAAGAGTKGPDGLVTPELAAVLEALTGTRAFGIRVLDKERSLNGAVAPLDPASRTTAIINQPLGTLSAVAAQGDQAPPTSLFELLARQARLMRSQDVALRILQREGMMQEDLRRDLGSADTFATGSLYGDVYITRWSYLFERISTLDGRFFINFPTVPTGLYNYLRSLNPEPTMAEFISRDDLYNGFAQHTPHDQDRTRLKQQEADLRAVGALPPARLERLVAEHLDLVGARLDAWRTGLAAMRLAELRAARPDGVYVGAFGCLVDVRPGGLRTGATSLPESLRDPARPTYRDADSEGFVLAPSPTHAVTAAILRSGYLSENVRPDLDNRMAINLSSHRVRMAQSILDAVRAGIDLGAALGYRLERALHDTYEREGITLDAWIEPLRRRFPTVGPVDPASVDVERARRHVVDGLELLETVRSHLAAAQGDGTLLESLEDGGRFSGYPWGLVDGSGHSLLPPTSRPDVLRALLRALDDLADAMDALGDLAVSESVFQIARGNFDRAAAVMSAAAEGRAMPEPEVVHTPRTGRLLSQKLLLAIPSIDAVPLAYGRPDHLTTRDAARPTGWRGCPLGPRAAVEPGFNSWVGSLLGPADEIVALVSNPATPSAAAVEVTATQLGLQPLDLVHEFDGGIQQGLERIAARVAALVRPPLTLPGSEPGVLVELRTRRPSWGMSRKTFFEVAPLLSAVRKLAGEARAANAADLVDSDSASSGMSLVDGPELEARAQGATAELERLALDLAALFGPPQAPTISTLLGDPKAFISNNQGAFTDPVAFWAGRGSFLALLDVATAFGITGVEPPSTFVSLEQAMAEIRTRTERSLLEAASRLSSARAVVGDPKGVLQAVFGKAFFVLPRFRMDDTGESKAALAANLLATRNAGPLELQRWFHGVAAVRERPRTLERITLLAEAFDRPSSTVKAIQFPERPGEHWLGGRLSAAGAPDGDRLSLVVVEPNHLNGTHGAALIVDEWNEQVPDLVQSAAAAFHYDAPDAAAPQVLLLVTPPEAQGKWRLEDLLLAMDETLDMAKSRLVEVEHLQDGVYGQLLPALIGEVVPRRVESTTQEIAGRRVILDFGANRAET